VIPWYRQLLSLIFGLGVILIALWGIDQGSGMVVVLGVAGMAFITLMLLFGIEIDYIEFRGNRIEFTNTSRDDDTDE
jgi:hypothetical protein